MRFYWTVRFLRCAYKREVAPLQKTHPIAPSQPPPLLSFLSLLLSPVIPSRLPRTRPTGEQASETPLLQILYGRGAIRFLGTVSYATARHCSSTSSTSTTSSFVFNMNTSTDADKAA